MGGILLILLLMAGTIIYIANKRHKIAGANTSTLPDLFLTNLTPYNRTENGFSLSWSSNAIKYIVYLDNEMIGQTLEKNYNFHDLQPDKNYSVKIVAQLADKTVSETIVVQTKKQDVAEPITTQTNITQFDNLEIQQYFEDIVYDKSSLANVTNSTYEEKINTTQTEAYLQFKDLENVNLTTEQLNQINNSRQGFYINASNEHVLIAASNKLGYLNGFYYTLYKLGFKALNFNNDWDITPTQLIPFTENAVKVKAVESFALSPTGAEWPENYALMHKFLKRNQLFVSIPVRSHTFEEVEMLKFAKAERFQSSKNYWEDIYNETGERPLLQDDKGKYRLPNINLGEPVWQMLVDFVKLRKNGIGAPLSPPDGANGESTTNLPPSKPEITNHHELYWYTAIEVAKRVNFKISFNVYGSGSLSVQPPKFVVPPNMELTYIPYAFQTYYLTDIEMFEDWEQKKTETIAEYGQPFSQDVYDYWNITSWAQNGKITFKYNQFLAENRIERWKNYGFNHIHIEGTFYSIPILPAVWLAASTYRDNQKTPTQYFNEYLNLMYGSGALLVKEMYSLFENYGFSVNVAPYWHQKLIALLNENLTAFERKNARRLAVYFNWWHKRWLAEQTMSDEDFENMLVYAHSFEELGLFQTNTLITGRKYGLSVPENYNFKSRSYYLSQADTINLDAEETYFRSLDYPILYDLVNVNYDIAKAQPLSAFEQTNVAPMHRYEAQYKIKVAEQTQFQLVVELANNSSPMKVQMFDDDIYTGDNMLINEKWEESERGANKTINVIIPPDRTFDLFISGGIQKTYFPDNVFVKYTDATRVGTIQKIEWYYVYIPIDAKKLIYKLYSVGNNYEYKFQTPDGNGGFESHPENNGNPFDINGEVIEGEYYNGANYDNTKLLVYNVPPNLRGKVWRTRIASFWRVPFMNFDKFYSRQLFEYNEN